MASGLTMALCRWLLQHGADPMWADASLVAGRMFHRLAYPLHVACMKDGGAELVAALVCAGAQMECRKSWEGCVPYQEGTPLFKAACIARYDSVQELVWLGASLKAPAGCTVSRAHPSAMSLWDEKAEPPPHDAELAAVLHPTSCSVCRVLQDLDGQVAFTQFYGLLSPFISPPHTYNLMPTTALLNFKSAVQAGLQKRRLLGLAVL